MITKSELEKLLASTETYRVERTKSTTDKDKFDEAETSCILLRVLNSFQD